MGGGGGGRKGDTLVACEYSTGAAPLCSTSNGVCRPATRLVVSGGVRRLLQEGGGGESDDLLTYSHVYITKSWLHK